MASRFDAGHASCAVGFLEIAAELPFHHAIDASRLLLFAQLQRHSPTSCAGRSASCHACLAGMRAAPWRTSGSGNAPPSERASALLAGTACILNPYIVPFFLRSRLLLAAFAADATNQRAPMNTVCCVTPTSTGWSGIHHLAPPGGHTSTTDVASDCATCHCRMSLQSPPDPARMTRRGASSAADSRCAGSA